jgi:hypothetical protein
MNKRFMNRKAGKVLAAAAAVAGFGMIAAPSANAGLSVDLRAFYVDPGGTISSDGSTVTLPNSSGNYLVGANVIAHLTGTDGVQNVANFDNKDKKTTPPFDFPANDTRNNELIQFLVGSFNTTGPLKGNYDASLSLPGGAFSGNGSHGAVAQDFDGDGSLDLGYAPGSSTDPTNLWSARANAPLGATLFVNKSNPSGEPGLSGMSTSPVDFNSGTTGIVDEGNAADQIIDANNSDVVIGQVYWTVKSGSGTSNLNFLVRNNGDAQALWYQDGSPNALNSVTNVDQYSMSPLTVTTGVVPEPASLGLLGLLGAGLVSRRRRKA